MPADQVPVFFGRLDFQTVGAYPVLFDPFTQIDHLLVQTGIITFHHTEFRHGFSRKWLDLTALPVAYFRLGYFVWGIVLQGQHNDVLDWLWQVHAGQGADFFGDGFVDVPIAFRFPGRRYGSLHGVDERVQVGGVEIVFLVPGGCRQH